MFADQVLKVAAQGFAVAITTSLLVMPLCMALARRLGVVDKPGGRKTHERVTPLLGGVGVVVATTLGFLVIQHQAERWIPQDLRFDEIWYVIAGSLVLFAIGLIDDIFKDSMTFQPKLLGQIIGVLVLMWPQLSTMVSDGATTAQWLYQLFFLGWYLTIVNSFNFSDNMNGLMSGLSVVAFGSAVLYLQDTSSARSMMVAVLLMGGLVGFLPYNFPRSRIFLGDAGSMFIGFWMARIQFDLVAGFMDVGMGDFGAHHLIPAVLIMGVPLYDAAFVVVMRIVERRPVYLGDAYHLSHRLVRGGFTSAEAVLILWGLGLILAWIGILSTQAREPFRYLLFASSLIFMIAVTRKIMAIERGSTLSSAPEQDPGKERS